MYLTRKQLRKLILTEIKKSSLPRPANWDSQGEDWRKNYDDPFYRRRRATIARRKGNYMKAATRMVDYMIDNPRASLTDASNAVLSGGSRAAENFRKVAEDHTSEDLYYRLKNAHPQDHILPMHEEPHWPEGTPEEDIEHFNRLRDIYHNKLPTRTHDAAHKAFNFHDPDYEYSDTFDYVVPKRYRRK